MRLVLFLFCFVCFCVCEQQKGGEAVCLSVCLFSFYPSCTQMMLETVSVRVRKCLFYTWLVQHFDCKGAYQRAGVHQ